MKRYVIQFAPNWCDGCLSYDTDAVSEEAALATIDRLLKENASVDLHDVTAVDVWEYPKDDDTLHLGCPSYPNCDEAPLGCRVSMGDNVEWYGHRD
jgi:hypothetical protein